MSANFKSITKEDFNSYESTFVKVKSIDEARNIILSYFDETKIFQSRDCEVLINGEYKDTFSISNVEEINTCLSLIEVFFYDTDEIDLNLKCNKDIGHTLNIINEVAFINTLSRETYSTQIDIWNGQLLKKYHHIKTKKCQINLKEYKEDISTKNVVKSNISEKKGFKQYHLNTSLISFIAGSVDSKLIERYLLRLRAVIALILISQRADLDGEANFYFEGDVKIDLKKEGISFLDSTERSIHEAFKWSFNDEKYIAKVGIINQVISRSRDIKETFNDNLIGTLSTLYNIYLHEDFENYIEIRNKISDSVIDMCNKITESIYQSRNGVKQTLFVTMSYFFSIFVFTAIDKGKVVNLFSLHVSILSTLFLIVSSLVIRFNQLDLESTISHYKEVLFEIKSRNLYLLSPQEISLYFDSKSIRNAIATSESKKLEYLSYFCFFVVFLLTWFMYFTREIFYSVPVYLHIV